MAAPVALSAERSEVAEIVGATFGDGLDVVDIGCRATAPLAALTIAYEHHRAQASPLPSRALPGMSRAARAAAEPTAHEAGLQNHPTTSKPCGWFSSRSSAIASATIASMFWPAARDGRSRRHPRRD